MMALISTNQNWNDCNSIMEPVQLKKNKCHYVSNKSANINSIKLFSLFQIDSYSLGDVKLGERKTLQPIFFIFSSNVIRKKKIYSILLKLIRNSISLYKLM